MSPSCSSEDSTPIDGILTDTGTDAGKTSVGDEVGAEFDEPNPLAEGFAGTLGAPAAEVVEVLGAPGDVASDVGVTDTVLVTSTVLMLGFACVAVGCGACC